MAGGSTLAEAFVDADGAGMRDSERAFIETVSSARHSFYDVIGRDPGRTLKLRDILRGVEYEVTERSASRSVENGDILFARVAPFDGFALLVGTGSIPLPPIRKGSILELRRSLREEFGEVTADLLREIAPELRALYLDIREQLLNPPPPQLRNTDGDPFEFHTLTWEVESAGTAFRALRRLAVGRTEEEILSGAEYDEGGRLRRIGFDWLREGNRMHKSWENTVLGHITIEGKRLQIEANSGKRAERIRREVSRRLGDRAAFLTEAVESTEAALRRAGKEKRTRAGRRSRREQEEFESRPEVQAVLKQVMETHWQQWVEERVPALGGKTPLEAVRDPDGREMVDALIMQFERYERNRPGTRPRVDFDALRARLGLRAGPGTAP